MIPGKEWLRPYYLKWIYFRLHPQACPSYFRDCWRFPEVDRPPAAPDTFDLLFFPMSDWHARLQRTQHLARAMAAAGHQCFYVNPHLGREFPHPYRGDRQPSIRQLQPGVFEVHVHLPREPVYHHRRLLPEENGRLVATLSDLLGQRPLVQVVSFPLWGDVARRLRQQSGAPIVYDCHDVLSGFRNIARELVVAETEVLRQSDLVLFSSLLLRDAHRDLPSLLVRNAVHADWVARAQPAIPGGPPVIGYIGALDYWFDSAALATAAHRHPEWQFELVGRVESELVRTLARFPNIRFCGEVPHAALHQHLARYRVALIPFQRNELTLGTNPIKLYEYFSYELPVVSSRLPELQEYAGLVYLADDPEDFCRQLEHAVAEKDPRLRHARRRVAEQETWTSRSTLLLQAFAQLLKNRSTKAGASA